MGMEVGSASVANLPAINYNKAWFLPESDNGTNDDSFLSHSAPTSSAFFTTASCRRAASFPAAAAAALAFSSGELHVRSQSEQAGLNKITVKVPRFQEIKLPVPAPTKTKCRVRFADDCGSQLHTVKVMTEPSDYPPQVPVEIIRRHRKAAGLEDLDDTPKLKSTWKVLFKQPASEYIKFRHKLETAHVALENVMLKNEVPKAIGTVKVGNISFEKRVFLRCTCDSWQTFKDYDAKFQVSASKAYDTFTFDIPLPSNVGLKESSFEFCICYTTGDGGEHWDSNEGKNYKLGGEEPVIEKPPASPPPPPYKAVDSKLLPMAKQRHMFNDAYAMDLENNWASFGSWKQLSVDVPYW